MALVEQLPAVSYLRMRGIRFDVAPHEGAYTARSEANALGLPAEYVLKVVVLRLSTGYAIVVVPASRRIDLDLIRSVIGDHETRLATEDEIAATFPEFDSGALPPLPGLLGVSSVVDAAIFDHDEVAFADGVRTESMIARPREIFWGENAVVAPIHREPQVWSPWKFEGDAVNFG